MLLLCGVMKNATARFGARNVVSTVAQPSLGGGYRNETVAVVKKKGAVVPACAIDSKVDDNNRGKPATQLKPSQIPASAVPEIAAQGLESGRLESTGGQGGTQKMEAERAPARARKVDVLDGSEKVFSTWGRLSKERDEAH
jgi:hypothetical protein